MQVQKEQRMQETMLKGEVHATAVLERRLNLDTHTLERYMSHKVDAPLNVQAKLALEETKDCFEQRTKTAEEFNAKTKHLKVNSIYGGEIDLQLEIHLRIVVCICDYRLGFYTCHPLDLCKIEHINQCWCEDSPTLRWCLLQYRVNCAVLEAFNS